MVVLMNVVVRQQEDCIGRQPWTGRSVSRKCCGMRASECKSAPWIRFPGYSTGFEGGGLEARRDHSGTWSIPRNSVRVEGILAEGGTECLC